MIRLEEHRPEWAEAFRAEAERIRAAGGLLPGPGAWDK
jgi:GrpB-like predicted nucleotidyltransferase (UPF0157 family)